MNKKLIYSLLLATTAIFLDACSETGAVTSKTSTHTTAGAFLFPIANVANYWYQGKAELSTYDVEQERYGEIRKAEQVNIFVTEDFSKSKQVKLDDAAAAGADACPVLKLNAVRKFKTGIYDYSLMSSVFSPMDGSAALKTTTTVQDWCGHVFSQNNLKSKGVWDSYLYSYFESEGDQKKVLSADYLEDEIWTQLRINPTNIKTGKVRIIPSSVYLRLKHKPLQPEDAVIELQKKDNMMSLVLNYTSIERNLTITFENTAPWRIKNWEETTAGKLTSKGTIKACRMEPYWEQNSNRYASMRDSLKLEY
jgi:hypothetical protein